MASLAATKKTMKVPATNPFAEDTHDTNTTTTPAGGRGGGRGRGQRRDLLRDDPAPVLPSSSTLSIDNQSSSVGLNRLVASSTTFSRNPFDDNGVPGGSAAPYDNDDDDSATTYTAGSGSVQLANSAASRTGRSASRTPASSSSSPPAEASWQYLGDLPYRRIPIYSNVVWHRNVNNDDDTGNKNNNNNSNSNGEGGGSTKKGNADERMMVDGLSCVPSVALSATAHRLSQWEIRQLVATTTRTIVAGCPHGGPIATVTVPAAAASKTSSPQATLWTRSHVKIMTNSGTEACMSAIRLARGFTKRDKIIKFDGCYHGHADSLLVKAGSGALTFGHPDSAGVPASFTQHTIVVPYNDPEALRAAFTANSGQVAGVIIEPVAGNAGLYVPKPGYLEFLREITAANGALLIFDEVMTGFRLAAGGAQDGGDGGLETAGMASHLRR